MDGFVKDKKKHENINRDEEKIREVIIKEIEEDEREEFPRKGDIACHPSRPHFQL